MRPSTLRQSLSHGSGGNARLVERQWQTACLTVVAAAVPLNISNQPRCWCCIWLSRVSGPWTSIPINGNLQWGVELMREGKILIEHVGLSAQDG